MASSVKEAAQSVSKSDKGNSTVAPPTVETPSSLVITSFDMNHISSRVSSIECYLGKYPAMPEPVKAKQLITVHTYIHTYISPIRLNSIYR